MTMRQRLYAILLMAVLALGGMGFLAYYNGRRILEAQIRSGGELAAESAAASVRNWLDGRTDIVLTAAMVSGGGQEGWSRHNHALRGRQHR